LFDSLSGRRIVRTGIPKKRKQYFSIAFIPHSGENVRVLRFSALYTKLLVFGALSVVVLLFSSAFVYSTVHDNLELKKNRDTLFTINAKQIEEIDRLRQDAGDLDVKIKAFTARYDELARTYISSNGISLFTSGSGHAKRVSVIENIRELEAILKTLEKMGAARGIDETSTSTTRKALGAYVSALPTSWPTRGIVASSFGGRPDPFNFS